MLLTRYLFQWLYIYGDQNVSGSDDTLFAIGALGAVFLVFRVFDAVTDPVAGWFTVSWLRKGNSKLSLLRIVSILAPCGMALCFIPDFTYSNSARWALVITGLAVFFIGYTFYAIPFWSLLDEMEEAFPGKRISFSNCLGVGLLAATAFGFIVIPIVVESLGYLTSALVIAVIALTAMNLPQFIDMRQSGDDKYVSNFSLKDALLVAKDFKFLSVLCLLAGSQMTFTTITATAPFFAVYFLKGAESQVSLLLGPLLLVAMLCLVVTPKIARAFGTLKAVLVGSTYLFAVCLLIRFCAFPEVVSLSTSVFFFCLAGPALALLLGLEGELVSIAATQANQPLSAYFGFYNFFIKLFNGVSFAVTGYLLAVFSESKDIVDLHSCIYFAAFTPFVGIITYYLLSSCSERSKHLST